MFNAFKTLKSPRPWGEDLGEGRRFKALAREPTPTPLAMTLNTFYVKKSAIICVVCVIRVLSFKTVTSPQSRNGFFGSRLSYRDRFPQLVYSQKRLRRIWRRCS